MIFIRRPLFLVPLFATCVSYGLAQQITEFALPEGVKPQEIIAGPGGDLWFTAYGQPHRTGRMSTVGVATVFPSRAREGYFPIAITAGPDGNVWLIDQDIDENGTISRMTPSGEHTEFLAERTPAKITTGPDRNLWFTTVFDSAIGRMTTAGQVTRFPLPQGGETFDITQGPDGNVWFTYLSRNSVGRITSAGVVTEYPIAASPRRITRGPDNNLWFTSHGNRIGRMTTSGAVTEIATSGRTEHVVAAPDGNVWFTYADASRVGRIRTDGTLIGDVTIPCPASGLTVGPDGNVWFTCFLAEKIGRITLAQAPTIDLRVLPVVGSTSGVGGSFFRTSVQLHNTTSGTIAGRIVFHPSGISGSDSDPALAYTLSPGQTGSFADLLPAMGRSGLGSADIEATSGSIPAATVRVFNDAGASGTTGFTQELMRANEALAASSSGVLLLPADLTRFRFNLGVRTLGAGAAATLTLRDAAGTVVTTVSRAFSATYHEQQSAAAFLGVSSLPAGGSLSISVTNGAAIFYGATVDNMTGDPSLQIARPPT